MKRSKHEILKTKWIQNIKDQNESGLTIRDWCKENEVTHGQYYYWLRIIREEALIKAGTLAVTGQTEFVEIKPSTTTEAKSIINNQGTCAILRSNGNEIEIINGADPNILGLILNFIGK
jgi:transposase-like protein